MRYLRHIRAPIRYYSTVKMRYPIVESDRSEFDFKEFRSSSDRDFPRALREIQQGEKLGHWIWYILPQLGILGFSGTSRFFGLKSIREAEAFIGDDILGGRLIEISTECLKHLEAGIPIKTLMGSGTDASKLLSSSTLFYFASINAAQQHHTLFESLMNRCKEALKTSCAPTEKFYELTTLCLDDAVDDGHIVTYVERAGFKSKGVVIRVDMET